MPARNAASSAQPETIAALSNGIDEHQAWLATSRGGDNLLLARARYRLRRLIERRAAEAVAALDTQALQAPLQQQLDQALQRIRNPG